MPKVSPAPSSPAKGLLRANSAERDAPVERGRSRTCINLAVLGEESEVAGNIFIFTKTTVFRRLGGNLSLTCREKTSDAWTTQGTSATLTGWLRRTTRTEPIGPFCVRSYLVWLSSSPRPRAATKAEAKARASNSSPPRPSKGQGQQGPPGVANPKAKPQATPKAEQPAAGKAPQPRTSRDSLGTPAVAKATPLGGSGSGPSSGGLPLAAPKAEGAAPPAEPKSAAPEPVPAASEETAPEPATDDPAPLTAAKVLPKEEPELDKVKSEEPGEEEAEEEEVVKEEAPDDDIDAGAAEAPVVDSVADAAPDDIDTGAAEAPDVDCVEAGDSDGA